MVNINKFLDHHGRPIVKKDDNFLNQKIQVEVEVEEDVLNPEYVETMAWIEENFVDLGLPSGTLWAKKNLGAETEYDVGLKYLIGQTEGYKYEDSDEYETWENCFCNGGNKNLDVNYIKNHINNYFNVLDYDERYDSYTLELKDEYNNIKKLLNNLMSLPNENAIIELYNPFDDPDIIVQHYNETNKTLYVNINGKTIKFIVKGNDDNDYYYIDNTHYDLEMGYNEFVSVPVGTFGRSFDYADARPCNEGLYIRPVITKESLETNLPPKTIKQTVTKTVEMTVKEYIDMKVAENGGGNDKIMEIDFEGMNFSNYRNTFNGDGISSLEIKNYPTNRLDCIKIVNYKVDEMPDGLFINVYLNADVVYDFSLESDYKKNIEDMYNIDINFLYTYSTSDGTNFLDIAINETNAYIINFGR